jgi:hypothetical protein
MPEIIANPLAHLDKLEPKLSPKKRELAKEQARIHKRLAKFEAQRAQEDAMSVTAPPPAGMQMYDVPTDKPIQRRMERKPIPQSAGQTVKPPDLVNRAAVQRVQRPAPPAAEPPPSSDILQELQAEFSETRETVEATTEPEGHAAPVEVDDDTDGITAILKRFKGSPEEVAKQLAKSYSHAEKRVRKLEQEKTLLMNPQATPAQAAPTTPLPIPQQAQVLPAFNYKRFKDDILDKGDEIAQEFEGHIAKTTEAKLAQFLGPVYNELVDNRLFRKYGDVVTEENLDVIKAMAQREQGENPWQKLEGAVAKYRQAMPSLVKKDNPDVQEMQAAVQTPAPSARKSPTQKMWKASDLRKQMQRPEYRYDPALRSMIDRAYAEGRVLRDQ